MRDEIKVLATIPDDRDSARNLSTILPLAIRTGKTYSASGGKWAAEVTPNTRISRVITIRHHDTDMLKIRYRMNEIITIRHHDTNMLKIKYRSQKTLQQPLPLVLVPLDGGWGSVSDKQGINKILRSIGIDGGYEMLFGAEPEPTPEVIDISELVPFTPPLTVADIAGL